MKRRLFGLFILCSMVSCINRFTSDTLGTVITEERQISDFNKIDVSGSVNLTVSKSDKYSVQITSNSNIINFIETVKVGNTLVIKLSNNQFIKATKLDVNIQMPSLDQLITSGSGNTNLQEVPNTASFVINKSGSGNLSITGTSSIAQFTIGGSGYVSANKFSIASLQIEKSGSGNANFSISDFIKGNISGSGNVTYSGSPIIEVKKSGSGNF